MQENLQKSQGTSHSPKVLFMITKGIWGGAQEYVYTLATEIRRNGFETAVACGEGNALPEKLSAAGVPVRTLPTVRRDISLLTEWQGFREIMNVIQQEKPDILHLNSSKIGFLGSLAGRLLGVPKIIFTAHNWASNESRPWIARVAFLIAHWLTVLLAHRTIAVSHKTRADMLGLPLMASRITVVHNGISDAPIADRDSARSKLHIANTPLPTIGTIAELHHNKGLDILINAAAQLKHSAQFYIIGAGEEKEHLERCITDAGLSHSVHLLGRVPHARQYLKAFDIFILPSRNEALPYVILEAGWAGLPVVASAVGGIPEIIENKKNGLLVPPRAPEITEALNYLILNPTEKERLGTALRTRIETEFSLHTMIDRTLSVYKN